MHVHIYGEYVHFECTVLVAVEDGTKNVGHLSKNEIFAPRSEARTKLTWYRRGLLLWREIYVASRSGVGNYLVSVNSNVSKKITSH